MPITRRSALCGALLLATPAMAQDPAWPTRTVRIVVPFPPGGTTDILARILAEQLQVRLGASFVVENRPGAGGSIGAEVVAKAEGDGYTLLMATIGTAAINYGLYGSKLPYKATDLVAVSNMANVPNVIVVPANSPSQTLPEFVTRAKGTAGGLTIASSGNGTSLHLTGELLKEATGIELVHVPYRGSGPMLIDVLAGRVDMAVDNLPSSLGHIKGGRMRALAVTSPQRSPSLPDVPTVREAGLPAMETVAWFGIQAPARTPRPVLDRLATAIRAVVEDPKNRPRIAEQGAEGVGDSPAEFQQLITAEIARWSAVIERAKVKVD